MSLETQLHRYWTWSLCFMLKIDNANHIQISCNGHGLVFQTKQCICVSSLTNICCKNDKFLEPGQVFKEKSPHLLTAAIPAAKLALRETLIRPWFVFLFAPFVQHIVCLIPICTAQFTLYSPHFHTYNSKVEWGGGGVIYIQWKIRHFKAVDNHKCDTKSNSVFRYELRHF